MQCEKSRSFSFHTLLQVEKSQIETLIELLKPEVVDQIEINSSEK